MYILYRFLLLLAAPFLLFGLYRRKAGKPPIGKRWIEHFGFSQEVKGERPIWLHAVSVGEVIAAKPIILALQARFPTTRILVTTTTTTGAAMASNIDGVTHRYMPIDFSNTVRRFIRRMQPSALLIMETELWPNTLRAAKKAGLPVIVLNARLSAKTEQSYQRIAPFFTQFTADIDHICCQFNEDAQRFIALGIAPDKLSVCGSIKFDLPFYNADNDDVIALNTEINQRPVWIAASTHQGEDEILLNAHQMLLTHLPSALLIIVPRHPERFNAVASLISEHGFALATRQKKQTITTQTQVYLGDTLGEMMTFFAVADVAFMAGSLLGAQIGGHNLLEPASLATPVLTGPSFYNFQQITEKLIAQDACSVCADAQEITHYLVALLQDEAMRKQAGHAALKVVEENRGASAATMLCVTRYLTDDAKLND